MIMYRLERIGGYLKGVTVLHIPVRQAEHEMVME